MTTLGQLAHQRHAVAARRSRRRPRRPAPARRTVGPAPARSRAARRVPEGALGLAKKIARAPRRPAAPRPAAASRAPRARDAAALRRSPPAPGTASRSDRARRCASPGPTNVRTAHGQDLVAAVAGDDLSRRDAVQPGRRVAERVGGGVGVAAQPLRLERADGLHHPRAGRVGVLVGVELDDLLARGRLSARGVAGHSLDVRRGPRRS